MLVQLTANSFRNLAPLAWRPAAGSHLLLGGNGAGKTSLLETVYVLATTKSFRTPQVADCIRHGAELFHVEGEIEDERRVRLEVGYGKDWRLRTVNGRNATLPEHLGVLPVVAWTTADVEILTGAPRLRRRLMDRGVVGTRPAALEVLSRYRQALRHKRGLLASGGPGLEAWNGVLASAAAELIARRAAYVAALREAFAQVVAEAELPIPAIELRYRPSPGSPGHAAAEEGPPSAEAIFASLERLADRERQRQLPLLGPHRDDLEVRWGDHEIARVASAGERKALALLLIAAHGRVLKAAGADPVYLLDDADAELAIPTLAAVWKVFSGARQMIATSNRPQAWLTLPVDLLWRVEAGRIDPL
ncbi:MAG TPA: DNA replication and repair protein RecF [Thermoanaerobaculia bacterium]|nr:DNA replication and repair protein RecF [Thermoanaerobaculia bacterium]